MFFVEEVRQYTLNREEKILPKTLYPALDYTLHFITSHLFCIAEFGTLNAFCYLYETLFLCIQGHNFTLFLQSSKKNFSLDFFPDILSILMVTELIFPALCSSQNFLLKYPTASSSEYLTDIAKSHVHSTLLGILLFLLIVNPSFPHCRKYFIQFFESQTQKLPFFHLTIFLGPIKELKLQSKLPHETLERPMNLENLSQDLLTWRRSQWKHKLVGTLKW